MQKNRKVAKAKTSAMLHGSRFGPTKPSTTSENSTPKLRARWGDEIDKLFWDTFGTGNVDFPLVFIGRDERPG